MGGSHAPGACDASNGWVEARLRLGTGRNPLCGGEPEFTGKPESDGQPCKRAGTVAYKGATTKPVKLVIKKAATLWWPRVRKSPAVAEGDLPYVTENAFAVINAKGLHRQLRRKSERTLSLLITGM